MFEFGFKSASYLKADPYKLYVSYFFCKSCRHTIGKCLNCGFKSASYLKADPFKLYIFLLSCYNKGACLQKCKYFS